MSNRKTANITLPDNAFALQPRIEIPPKARADAEADFQTRAETRSVAARHQMVICAIARFRDERFLQPGNIKICEDKARIEAFKSLAAAGHDAQLSERYIAYCKDSAYWTIFAPKDKPYPFGWARGPEQEGNDWLFQAPFDKDWAKWFQSNNMSESVQGKAQDVQPVKGNDAKKIAGEKEATRREALKREGLENFAGLDVWPYGEQIRGGQGADAAKLKHLRQELYGTADAVYDKAGPFALPILPHINEWVSEQMLKGAERYVDYIRVRIVLIKVGSMPVVKLTLRDGVHLVEATLDAFIRAWNLLLYWYNDALAMINSIGPGPITPVTINVSFSRQLSILKEGVKGVENSESLGISLKDFQRQLRITNLRFRILELENKLRLSQEQITKFQAQITQLGQPPAPGGVQGQSDKISKALERMRNIKWGPNNVEEQAQEILPVLPVFALEDEWWERAERFFTSGPCNRTYCFLAICLRPEINGQCCCRDVFSKIGRGWKAHWGCLEIKRSQDGLVSFKMNFKEN